MNTRFTLLLIFGIAYFYTLSNLPIPFAVKSYLGVVPFQISAILYFVYPLLLRQRPKRITDNAETNLKG